MPSVLLIAFALCLQRGCKNSSLVFVDIHAPPPKAFHQTSGY
ncbi:hypothetical protein DSUL_20310 [Desulfovibrionales bacterium]